MDLRCPGRNDNGMNSSGINTGAGGNNSSNANTVGKLDSANVTRVLYQLAQSIALPVLLGFTAINDAKITSHNGCNC
eukprot:2931-Heterococcus_DN1.PRE.6